MKRLSPTVLVVFGATGDLMAKKIMPAVFHLFLKNRLPRQFRLLGFSRRRLSDDQFRRHGLKIIKQHLKSRPSESQIKSFFPLLAYQPGSFEKPADYRFLAERLEKIDRQWGVCSNKIFYLATPPHLYRTIFKHLAASGLTKPCAPEEGWTRVVVEKPFGKDLKTARELDAILGSLFREEQIYRIDHYLAKEMLQNILAFRFANNLFEENWSNRLIEKIEIKLLEKVGVEGRGDFYDGVGALRDVGQNHLLQMLALITMEHPRDFEAEAIRGRRAEVLQSLKIPSLDEIKHLTLRAQYRGYRRIKGVSPRSQTETYFKLIAFLDNPRWQGVPVVLESGKRMGELRKEIVITLRHPTPCLCPAGGKHYRNQVIIRLEPNEEIKIRFWAKKAGPSMLLEEKNFHFLFRGRKKKIQYTEEYEKLLLDCLAGDQTLFVSTAEIQAMWRFIDPILRGWSRNLVPLRTYQPDTKEIFELAGYPAEAAFIALPIRKEVGLVGLGKMGGNIARQLLKKGWRVHGYNRSIGVTKDLAKEGVKISYSLAELAAQLSPPRLIWLMVPAGKETEQVIFGPAGLVHSLKRGDIIIDGGNSFYRDSVRRAERLRKRGIRFLDVGVSGGPSGARYGASLMVGGEKKIFKLAEPLFRDLAIEGGYAYLGPSGAGHFVKMIHNGIEYGMMQAIAEGFTILKRAKYKLSLKDVAQIYNHGSVIESRLVGWLNEAFQIYGEDLRGVSGRVGHTGEGEWTVKTAKEEGVKAKVIEEALKFRLRSEKAPSYTGRILSALRNRFGGHQVK